MKRPATFVALVCFAGAGRIAKALLDNDPTETATRRSPWALYTTPLEGVILLVTFLLLGVISAFVAWSTSEFESARRWRARRPGR